MNWVLELLIVFVRDKLPSCRGGNRERKRDSTQGGNWRFPAFKLGFSPRCHNRRNGPTQLGIKCRRLGNFPKPCSKLRPESAEACLTGGRLQRPLSVAGVIDPVASFLSVRARARPFPGRNAGRHGARCTGRLSRPSRSPRNLHLLRIG